MTSLFDEIEELVMKDAREIYSETTIDHFLNPRHYGVLEQADGQSQVTGPCGDTISIWLKVRDGAITEITFTTDGCGTSIASGSMVTVLAKGRMVEEAYNIGQQDVLDALGGLPEENEHCGLLASMSLKEAIKDYRGSKG
jgi:nitrogen fixation NifU-like protein